MEVRIFFIKLHNKSFCSSSALLGNSAYKLCHTSSVAYSVELVLLNKHQISVSRACLHCYPLLH